MQYNESDAAFLRRLWKRRGLTWFVQAGPASAAGGKEIPGHTLVLFDHPQALERNAAGTVRHHRDDGAETRDSITVWHALRSLTAGRVTRHSWDYMQARPFESEEASRNDQGVLGNQFAASLDDYLADAPHCGDDAADHRGLATLRMQRHEYEAKYFEGKTDAQGLTQLLKAAIPFGRYTIEAIDD